MFQCSRCGKHRLVGSDRLQRMATQRGIAARRLSPKLVYKALKKLIHETWRTETSGKTDGNGLYKFRGFHGEYRIQVENPSGEIVNSAIHVEKEGGNGFRLTLPGKND